jgi:hypothetical protein
MAIDKNAKNRCAMRPQCPVIFYAVLKSEVQHLDSYKVLPWKNNINSFSLKSG